MSHVTTWASFYIIIGSAGATLTGLMFVIIALAGGRRHMGVDGPLAAFATPTIVHFGFALLIAAILNAPWPELWQMSIALGLCSLGGVIYAVIVLRRARRQTRITPVIGDWVWHVVLPHAAHIGIVIAAIVLVGNPTPALFIIGVATVLLLFIGIHNAWDSATYHIIALSQPMDTGQSSTGT